MKKEYIQPFFMAINNEIETTICAASPGSPGYDYGGGDAGKTDGDKGAIEGGGGGGGDDNDDFNVGSKRSSWGSWDD